MKKTILLLATILFTLSAKSQEEFSRAYLNVLISYEDSLSYYDGANAFTFNVDGNSIIYYPHSGPSEKFIYVSGVEDDVDRYGDEYQIIKTIEASTSEIVYFQLYKNLEFGLNMIFEEPTILIHFYNKAK
tara:strand:+ start:455 stop:844 length:390 start_codon:yes stop_codon:yes gene_type:complete